MLRGPDDLDHHPVPRLFRHDKEHVVRLERSRVPDRNEIFRQRFLPVFVVLAPTLKPPNAIAWSQRFPSDRLNNPPKEAVRILRPAGRIDEKRRINRVVVAFELRLRPLVHGLLPVVDAGNGVFRTHDAVFEVAIPRDEIDVRFVRDALFRTVKHVVVPRTAARIGRFDHTQARLEPIPTRGELRGPPFPQSPKIPPRREDRRPPRGSDGKKTTDR